MLWCMQNIVPYGNQLTTTSPLSPVYFFRSETTIVILRYSDMGITKSEVFKKRQNHMATLAKAFDHPARVAILEYLLTNRTCITNDLVNVLPLSQSTISQHLKELKQIGIIKGEVEGPKLNYCIDEQVWEDARDVFMNFFSKYVPKNCC